MEEIVISRESVSRRDSEIENSPNINGKRRVGTTSSDLRKTDWPDNRQDMLVRERAYRSLLTELKAELREKISSRTADVKLLKELSSKHGVSLTWYFLRIAVPVLDADFKQ